MRHGFREIRRPENNIERIHDDKNDQEATILKNIKKQQDEEFKKKYGRERTKEDEEKEYKQVCDFWNNYFSHEIKEENVNESVYELIFEELQNRVDYGEITIEKAEEVNDLAYEKYIMSESTAAQRYMERKAKEHGVSLKDETKAREKAGNKAYRLNDAYRFFHLNKDNPKRRDDFIKNKYLAASGTSLLEGNKEKNKERNAALNLKARDLTEIRDELGKKLSDRGYDKAEIDRILKAAEKEAMNGTIKTSGDPAHRAKYVAKYLKDNNFGKNKQIDYFRVNGLKDASELGH